MALILHHLVGVCEWVFIRVVVVVVANNRMEAGGWVCSSGKVLQATHTLNM